MSEELNNVATDFVSQGVVGTFTSGSPNTGAFAVTQDASADMGVTILAGRAYVLGTPQGQDSQVLSARMTSNFTTYTINSNSSGSTKFDWIYLQLSATNASTPSSAADNVITLVTSRSTSNATDNGSPPTYGLLLAVVTVANGASSITNGNITDKRVQSSLSVQSAATTGWQTLGFPLTYSANNGNKEFAITTPNNLTGVLSAGMKLNITRSVTPPTQCMAFASASSQFASKATPSGISFTAAFTCEAWIYLNSYTGTSQFIMERENGTSGWGFNITATGKVNVYYGASSGFTNFTSTRSIPLNRWVHVAGAVTSVSSKTAAVYIDGYADTTVLVGTTTTLTQPTANLQIGAYNTPNQYFNGFMSEVRLWSVAQTQSNIQSNMAVNLVGNETNLVGLWQGSGNFNDATSNANNMTAQAGASSTQANNPYNPVEYGVIANVNFSNPTTTVTLHTGPNGNIPNQTLNTPQYSTAENPYGLPAGLESAREIGSAVNCGVAVLTAGAGDIEIVHIQTYVPGNRKVFISAYIPNLSDGGAAIGTFKVLKGSVGGTLLNECIEKWQGSDQHNVVVMTDYTEPSGGEQTYYLTGGAASSNLQYNGSITSPCILSIKVG